MDFRFVLSAEERSIVDDAVHRAIERIIAERFGDSRPTGDGPRDAEGWRTADARRDTAAALARRIEEAKAAEAKAAPPRLPTGLLHAIDCGPLTLVPPGLNGEPTWIADRDSDEVARLSHVYPACTTAAHGRLFAASIDLADALLKILNADGFVSYRAEAVAALKAAGLVPEDAR